MLSLGGRLIAALPQGSLDPFQNDIVNFTAFLEGGLAQGFIDWLRQIDRRMDYPRPLLAARWLLSGPWTVGGGWGALGHTVLHGLPRAFAGHSTMSMP